MITGGKNTNSSYARLGWDSVLMFVRQLAGKHWFELSCRPNNRSTSNANTLHAHLNVSPTAIAHNNRQTCWSSPLLQQNIWLGKCQRRQMSLCLVEPHQWQLDNYTIRDYQMYPAPILWPSVLTVFCVLKLCSYIRQRAYWLALEWTSWNELWTSGLNATNQHTLHDSSS